MGMFMRTSAGIAVAQKVYAAATAFATMIQNSLNISFATFLALTGVGIAVIVAAAAAMWSFANSMNSATASVQGFNEATAETPTRTRGIRRAGEEELYRRGVE
jgi:ABC-type lipoprotein release transport system permease subunit